MTKLYIVRHAHSTYTTEERTRPLSKEGRADANALCEKLSMYPIDIIVSSPYQRAVETVKPLADYLHKQVHTMEGWKERTLVEGGAADFQKAIEAVWEDESFSWPGGESNVEARDRGVQALNQLLEKYNGKHVVVGTHGNIMTLIMGAFDTNYDVNFWRGLRMPDVYTLTFEDKELACVERIDL
ncbi:histidine phosphatase family protein [Halobacillus salinus]|uniref:histidine phosphatase family protein n=1 Tax=Halobacillus salinus TaxID=192814 RepID=UPI0009A848D0|nr:histidine phosphatase family protein [Halobacillus salinus]